MEEIRCIKCGRPLSDPKSIARGMGPECAGDSRGHRKKYHSPVPSRSGSSYETMDHRGASTPSLFSLAGDVEQRDEQVVIEKVTHHKSRLTEILMKYPTDLIDLVLSAPASGAIARHVKNYAKKKKPAESMPPGRTLQEIRRMCIDLRLTFWPGMSNHQGQQIACVPFGDEGWRFENSERVMSRQELESYLARYGMIRSAGR